MYFETNKPKGNCGLGMVIAYNTYMWKEIVVFIQIL